MFEGLNAPQVRYRRSNSSGCSTRHEPYILLCECARESFSESIAPVRAEIVEKLLTDTATVHDL